MKPTTILVTGATGTVGRQVVSRLAGKDVNVRAAVYNAAHADRVKYSGVSTVKLDFERPKSYARALAGADKVFLITAPGPNMPDQTEQFAAEAKRAGVRHIVKLSAFKADTKSSYSLGRIHRQAEIAIENSGIPFTHLRPNIFMQNFVKRYGASIKAEGEIHQPLGEAPVAFFDARDVAATAISVLTGAGHKGQAYSLTGSRALTYYEAASILAAAIDKRIEYIDIPREAAVQIMKRQGASEWLTDMYTDLWYFSKAGGFSQVNFTFTEVTGYKPRSFETFAADYASSFR